MSDDRVQVSFKQFLLTWLAILRMQAVDAIAPVVVDLSSIVCGEITASGFGVLPCDSADQGRRFVMRLQHLWNALIETNLI